MLSSRKTFLKPLGFFVLVVAVVTAAIAWIGDGFSIDALGLAMFGVGAVIIFDVVLGATQSFKPPDAAAGFGQLADNPVYVGAPEYENPHPLAKLFGFSGFWLMVGVTSILIGGTLLVLPF